jgi:hypothetical protein
VLSAQTNTGISDPEIHGGKSKRQTGARRGISFPMSPSGDAISRLGEVSIDPGLGREHELCREAGHYGFCHSRPANFLP